MAATRAVPQSSQDAFGLNELLNEPHIAQFYCEETLSNASADPTSEDEYLAEKSQWMP